MKLIQTDSSWPKLYTHLDKNVSKVSTNFEIKWICKSIANQKTQIKPGFSWGFQNDFRSDHNQNLLEPDVRRGLKSDIHPQGYPQQHPQHKNSNIITKSTKRREGKKAKTISNKKLQQPQTEHMIWTMLSHWWLRPSSSQNHRFTDVELQITCGSPV